jgi:hypothetical protein
MSELQYLNIQFALLNPTASNVKGGLQPIGHASALAHQNGWLKDRDRCLEMTTTVFSHNRSRISFFAASGCRAKQEVHEGERVEKVRLSAVHPYELAFVVFPQPPLEQQAE